MTAVLTYRPSVPLDPQIEAQIGDSNAASAKPTHRYASRSA
jgi:hypothetical protein